MTMEKGLHVLSNISTTAFTLLFPWGSFLAGLLFLHKLTMPLVSFLKICILFSLFSLEISNSTHQVTVSLKCNILSSVGFATVPPG